jgi:hypothetical protein
MTIIEINKAIVEYLQSQGLNADMFGYQDNVIIDETTDYVINVIVSATKLNYIINRGYLLINIAAPNLSDGRANLKRLYEITSQVISILPEKIDNIYIDLDSFSQSFYKESDKNYSFVSLRLNYTQT